MKLIKVMTLLSTAPLCLTASLTWAGAAQPEKPVAFQTQHQIAMQGLAEAEQRAQQAMDALAASKENGGGLMTQKGVSQLLDKATAAQGDVLPAPEQALQNIPQFRTQSGQSDAVQRQRGQTKPAHAESSARSAQTGAHSAAVPAHASAPAEKAQPEAPQKVEAAGTEPVITAHKEVLKKSKDYTSNYVKYTNDIELLKLEIERKKLEQDLREIAGLPDPAVIKRKKTTKPNASNVHLNYVSRVGNHGYVISLDFLEKVYVLSNGEQFQGYTVRASHNEIQFLKDSELSFKIAY